MPTPKVKHIQMQSSRTTDANYAYVSSPHHRERGSSLNSNWILIDATGMELRGPAGDPFALLTATCIIYFAKIKMASYIVLSFFCMTK
jgi:hypothetical protein